MEATAMTAPTQPPHAPSRRRRLGWRSSLGLAAILAAGAVPLLVGAMRQQPAPAPADHPVGPAKALSLAQPSALIQMKRHAPRVIDEPGGRESEAEFATFRRTELARLQGDAILREALKRPEVRRLRCVAKEEGSVSWARTCLEVEAIPDSELVRVSFRCEDAAESAVIVNAVAEQYVADFCEQQRRERAERIAALEKALAECQETLANVRRALEKLKQDAGGQGGPQIDLRQEVAAHEETKRWLRRELDRQRLECRAADRVRVMARADLEEK
jgi:hypothetical protein